jgi:hypothetical protein
MKMKKDIRKMTRYGSFVSLVVALTAMLLAGCALPMLDLQPAEAGKAMVQVSIGTQNPGARTIYPEAPVFTKYLLSFKANNEQPDKLDMEIGSTSIALELDPGSWTITAYGYALFNGVEAVVAEGSQDVIATAGTSINVAIAINASIVGDPGKFLTLVTVPQGIPASSYKVTVQVFGESSSTLHVNAPVINTDADFIETKSEDYDPGYYLVTAQLYFGHTMAVKTEIVHIYSNMTSSVVFDFSASDFVPTVQLAGTLSVTLNGILQTGSAWTITAYTELNNSYASSIGSTSPGENGDWNMLVTPFSSPTIVYFRLDGTDASGKPLNVPLVSSQVVSINDLSGISLVYSASYITLSGTLSVTLNGTLQNVAGWRVQAYPSTGGNSLGYTNVDASGVWSMRVEKPASPTLVSFGIFNSTGQPVTQQAIGSQNVNTADISGISLVYNASIITLSGTLDVKLNGVDQDVKDWYISANDVSGKKSLEYTQADASGTWSMQLDALSAETPVSFHIQGQDNSGRWVNKEISGTWNVSNTDVPNISLNWDTSIVWLSGTLDVKVDGSTQDVQDWNVDAFTDPDDPWESGIGYTSDVGADGSWSLFVEAPASSTDVYFMVTDDNDTELQLPVSRTIGTSDISNIPLSASFVTLSGTVSGTLNGSAVTDFTDWELDAYSDSNYSSSVGDCDVESDGSWIMTIPAFSVPTQVYFCINDPIIIPLSKTAQVSTSAVTGISLTIAVTTKTLSGTVSGFTSPGIIYAILDATSLDTAIATSIGYGFTTGSNWTFQVDSSMLNHDMYFVVICDNNPDYYVSKSSTFVSATGMTGITINYSDTKVLPLE